MIATVERVDVIYDGQNEQIALKQVNIEIKSGDFISIQGPSGSGKSTLLHLLGCLLKPTSGKISILGKNIANLKDRELAGLRGEYIGFVPQGSHLVPTLTVLENIVVPLRFRRGLSRKEKQLHVEGASALIEQIGLADKIGRLPYQLSIGERRRVAIARALVNRPKLILADEPTAGIDPKRADQIVDLLGSLVGTASAVVMVTHDQNMAARAARQYELIAGELKSLISQSDDQAIISRADA